MKKIITIILLFISTTTFSQSKEDSDWKARLNKIDYRINDIEKKNFERDIISLKEKLEFQQKMIDQSNSSISNQLGSASYSLTLFGILFAIAAVGLGIYVTYIERKIVNISEENKGLLIKNQKIKKDVEELNKLIQSDIYNLFLKIKREESVHILDRLVKVPKDIMNVCDTLLSRELEQEDFAKLRIAYLKLGENQDIYHQQYHIVFFQHFLDHSLRDEKLRQNISEFITIGISGSFENDIVKSTSDFVTVIVDKGIQEFKPEINLFFEGLTNSEYKNYDVVYQSLFDNLKTRKNRFETFNVVESTQQTQQAKIKFGTLLQNSYANDNPTESERLVYTELKELTIAQQKAEKEEKQKAEELKKQQEDERKQQEEHQRQLAEQKNTQSNDKN